MDLQLKRTSFAENGIFGELQDMQGNRVAYTLEHAYQQDDGSWQPKVPAGTYTCQLGSHQLAHMTHPFQTYEITNVPGHSSILYHSGNLENDSSGCVLLGDEQTADGLLNSRIAFNKFMVLENNAPTFNVTVNN